MYNQINKTNSFNNTNHFYDESKLKERNYNPNTDFVKYSYAKLVEENKSTLAVNPNPTILKHKRLYDIFVNKHLFKGYDKIDQHLKLYIGKRPPTLITLLDRIPTVEECNYVQNPITNHNQDDYITKQRIKTYIYNVRDKKWVTGLYQVKLTFQYDRYDCKFLPMHIAFVYFNFGIELSW